MTFEMKKYPKIGQLKDVIYSVIARANYAGTDAEGNVIYKAPDKLPTLTFEGTVKLHGTNAAVVICEDAESPLGYTLGYQSRNRKLTLENDNAGFVQWMSERPELHVDMDEVDFSDGPVYVYGEFCGGNIQKGVGISGLPKMFVTFEPVTPLSGEGIYSIHEFPIETLRIDFNNMSEIQNSLVDITKAVEEQCPVALALGVEGIGEGMVWKSVDSPEYGDLMFKVKGEKHSKSHVKTLSEVDLALLNERQKLARELLTSERLEQGLQYLTEMKLDLSRRSTGQFLKYVVSDCIAEETIRLEEEGVAKQDIGKVLNQVAKEWFFDRVAI